ncbi:APC family permease [Nocardiopsis sp. YSL2]|uniref:APC family permease n=1 Tax=Nocardiopsis sp. YSL2 TaxID=2939492 RepID=UPI0026F41F65|nr:APC family permease [Nocardiopsis sp. YSL2]
MATIPPPAPAVPPPVPTGRPLRRSIGVLGGVAIAASSTAATTTIGIGLTAMALTVGPHLPAVLLLGVLPILCIAGAYTQLNRVEPNAGNTYVWVGRSLSPWLGFLVGWTLIVATVAFLAYTTAVTGSAILQTALVFGVTGVAGLDVDPGSTAQGVATGVLVLVAVTLTAVAGLRTAARFQVALLVFEYAVLLGFLGYGAVTGPNPFSWDWFNPFALPSAQVLAQGLLLSVFCYWGFEAAFSVNEEVRDPRDASRAGLITLLSVLGLFMLGSVAFQRVLSDRELTESGEQGLAVFAGHLAGQPWATLPLVALMFSAVASLQAGVIPTARAMFAMSRDRTLGPLWSRVSPRFGTPAAGTVALGSLAAAVAVLSLAIPRLSDVILATVNSVGLLIALIYVLTALAAVVRFLGLFRRSWRAGLVAVVLPLLGGTVLLVITGYLCWLFATGTDHFAVDPDNGWFLLTVPALMLASGLVAAAWARWVRKSPYFLRGNDPEQPAEPAPTETVIPEPEGSNHR